MPQIERFCHGTGANNGLSSNKWGKKESILGWTSVLGIASIAL
jgi:hypothetical protein